MSKATEIIEQNDSVTRRTALHWGLAGAATFIGMTILARHGLAFTLQEADEATSLAFHNACGNTQYHDQLAGEVRSILMLRKTPANAMPQTVTCPICSCKVAVQ